MKLPRTSSLADTAPLSLNFRRGSRGFYLVILLMVLWINSVSADEEPDIVVAVSVTPLSAPFIVAAQQGFFEQEGVLVAFNKFIGGQRTAQALFNGEADMATSSEAVVMFNSFKRDDFAIAATFVQSDNDVKILATRKSGIHTVSDLAGKRVGTILGASAHFFLDHTLLINDVPTEGVTLVGIHPEETILALQEGELDAVASWEPFVYQTRKTLGDEAVIVPHGKVYIETFNVLVLRDWAAANKEKLHAVLRSLIKAVDYIKNNPSRSKQMVATYLGKDPDIINATWDDLQFDVSLHQWLISTMEAEARWALQRGYAKGQEIPNYFQYLLVDPLRQVSPNSVTVID